MTLRKSDRIYIAGHNGLVGRALVKVLREKGYDKLITASRQELDLLDTKLTYQFLKDQKPDVVFLAAAKVGGINANNIYSADFLYENLGIQNNVIWGSHLNDVRKVVFLGSSCIYPKLAPQPISESSLLTGTLEPTNQPYAIAKIAGLELIKGLRRQYGRPYFSVMPTNLFGPGDNFDLESSHVLPALVRKIIEAKRTGATEVEIWGSGMPLREFMYSEDCADAIIHAAENCTEKFFKDDGITFLNIGTGQEVSIKDLAVLICRIIGFEGSLRFNASKPDGTPRKRLDVSLLDSLKWKPKTSLETAIQLTVDWYRAQALETSR